VSGYYKGSAQFGSATLPNVTSGSGFITKLSNVGNYLWTSGLSDYATITSFTIDTSNEIGLICHISGNWVIINNITYYYSNGATFFIKIDKIYGNYTLVQQNNIYARDIESNTDSYFITGGFSSTTQFGSYLLTPNGKSDCFIAKLDKNFNYTWVKGKGTSNLYESGEAIFVDNDGNCYIDYNCSNDQVVKWSNTGSESWSTPGYLITNNADKASAFIKKDYEPSYSCTYTVAKLDQTGNLGTKQDKR